MKTTRYAASRQKACQQCSNAKAKCDRKVGGCTRCAQRGLSCAYLQATSPRGSSQNVGVVDEENSQSILSTSDLSAFDGQLPSPESQLHAQEDIPTDAGSALTISSAATRAHHVGDPSLNATPRRPSGRETLDFSGLQLVCPINADEISNRWLRPYIPVAAQTIKRYPTSVTAFIYRILKSYAAITVRGRGVPKFVHSAQMAALATSPPLSTCLSLARICERPLPGSEEVACDVLQREMNNLYELHETYDDLNSLAALQAYLIYSMVLFFQLGQHSNPFLRQAMMNLQEIACSSCRRGLTCLAEQQRSRPGWEAWIVAEAKRRTIFTMYLFDSVLSVQDGLPTFLGTELQGLLAPASKSLWQAQDRYEWETLYNIHLAEWSDEGLRIDELWPVPADLDEADVAKRSNRVDRWLEDLDEYGTMLYAVTSCTHGV
ncbi:hypothetical protein AAE478_008791 [Parahypoxylon ruwenzoriense]